MQHSKSAKLGRNRAAERVWLLGAHAAHRKRSQEAAAAALEPVEAAGAAQAVRPAFPNSSLEGCCIKPEPGLDGVPLVTPEHSLREKSQHQQKLTQQPESHTLSSTHAVKFSLGESALGSPVTGPQYRKVQPSDLAVPYIS